MFLTKLVSILNFDSMKTKRVWVCIIYSKIYLPARIISLTYSTQGTLCNWHLDIRSLAFSWLFLYLYKIYNLTWCGFCSCCNWMFDYKNVASESATGEVNTGFAIGFNSNRIRSRTCLIPSSKLVFLWEDEQFCVTSVRKQSLTWKQQAVIKSNNTLNRSSFTVSI